MNLSRFVVVFAMSILGGPCLAQPIEPWTLPDPNEMIKATNLLCADQAKSVLATAAHKKNGRNKEEVIALIPESPKAFSLRLVTAMRENVEDIYQFPEISQYTYYSYRSEVCMRETLGAVRMPRFSTVQPKITECQKQHGTEKNNALFKCVQSVVREAQPL